MLTYNHIKELLDRIKFDNNINFEKFCLDFTTYYENSDTDFLEFNLSNEEIYLNYGLVQVSHDENRPFKKTDTGKKAFKYITEFLGIDPVKLPNPFKVKQFIKKYVGYELLLTEKELLNLNMLNHRAGRVYKNLINLHNAVLPKSELSSFATMHLDLEPYVLRYNNYKHVDPKFLLDKKPVVDFSKGEKIDYPEIIKDIYPFQLLRYVAEKNDFTIEEMKETTYNKRNKPIRAARQEFCALAYFCLEFQTRNDILNYINLSGKWFYYFSRNKLETYREQARNLLLKGVD